MIAVVGLGNPGREYDKTMHNMGYMAIDHFAEKLGIKFSKNKFYGKVAETMIDGEKVILLKPETFMNLSGKSVEDMMHLLKLDVTRVLVLVDDIDIDFASIRLRSKGSAGTHNGLRDIVHRVGENFPRVRIGVGRPDNGDLISYVLSRVPESRMQELENTFDKVSKVIEYFVSKKTIEGLDINRL